jgi:twitching motility protein PilT
VSEAGQRLNALLRDLVARQASDLHLKPRRPPLVRIDGRLVATDAEPLVPDALAAMLDAVIPSHLRAKLDAEMSIDFGYGVEGVSRFRASIFCQRGTRAAVFRRVPFDFPTLDQWGLPPILEKFCDLGQGLVLITGPTGSGKSSTLAGMLRRVSMTRPVHIVTIEDPIEFLISDAEASVSQREIGIDAPSFGSALRSVLRQDPDVIMVGEMRDEETIRTVLTAAETGHLVFSTLHTNSASQTIDRIMTDFAAGSHHQLCQQLAACLEGIVSMQLVPRANGEGQVAAVEILRRSPQISKLISTGSFDTLDDEIESSVSYYKMQSMNQSLAALVVQGTITKEMAMHTSNNPGDLDLLLRKVAGAVAADRGGQGDMMAECTSDFSKIFELQEVKKHYDDLQKRHREEVGARDREIAELREQLRALSGQAQPAAAGDARVEQLESDNRRLAEQIQRSQAEYEGKIERLTSRIRELGAKAGVEPAAAAKNRGFFGR